MIKWHNDSMAQRHFQSIDPEVLGLRYSGRNFPLNRIIK